MSHSPEYNRPATEGEESENEGHSGSGQDTNDDRAIAPRDANPATDDLDPSKHVPKNMMKKRADKKETVRLQLDLDLKVDLTLKATVYGSVELALLDTQS